MISDIKCRRAIRSEWRLWIWNSWRCRVLSVRYWIGEKYDTGWCVQTGKLEDQVFISGSTLEYMRENWGGRETEYSFDTIVKLAEWHVKVKYPRMIARLPMELAWASMAEDGAKVHFGHYEVQPLVPLSVFFVSELDLINPRDR